MVKNILLPAIFLCLMKFTISVPENLKLGIYNGEVTTSDGTCEYKQGCFLSKLSCRYLEQLKNQSITVHYADLESAINAAKYQNVSAVVYTNENFTNAFVARLILGEDSDDETIEYSKIRVWLDSNGKNADILTQLLKTSYNAFIKDLFTICELRSFQNSAEDGISYSPLAVYEKDTSDSKPSESPPKDCVLS